MLVETDWLQQHLGDAGLRLIDTRSAELYAAGHIPGAVNLAAYGAIPREANGDMAGEEAFGRYAGAMGIGADATVVVYDAPGAQMGATAWAFMYYGHADVHVLDGGFKKWIAEGREPSTEPGSYLATSFDARAEETIYCSLDHARGVHGSPNTIFWDVRRPGEYDGSEPVNNARPGHIPGAVHLEWTELLDADSGTFKSATELRSLLASRGITPESEVNCY
jgi:thiosulfate/3-mercaptopyruvate sulfurtransferase